MRVLGICGSLQRESGNLTLLRTAARIAPSGVEVRLFDGIRRLPHFDPDVDKEGAPSAVNDWRRELRESDALLIASPEYGHSMPGALKNAVDWVIGSGELYRKVVATTAAVPTAERGQRGLDALKQTLIAVDATVVGGVPIAKGAMFESEIRALLVTLIERVRETSAAVDVSIEQ